MFTKEETVSLTNLGDGAALELFDAELEKVLENILDPNVEAKATREITLKVVMKPDENRELGAVRITAQSKLAGSRMFITKIVIGKNQKGMAEAREFSVGQQSMFDKDDEETAGKVTLINGGQEK